MNRIFGEDVAAGKHEQNGTQLLNVSGGITNWGKLTGYYYRIDDQVTPLFSTSTAGARFVGQHKVERVAIRYAAEFANQSDAADNPASDDATYAHANLGLIIDALDVGVGYELLSGDNDGRLVTPLATTSAPKSIYGSADRSARTSAWICTTRVSTAPASSAGRISATPRNAGFS